MSHNCNGVYIHYIVTIFTMGSVFTNIEPLCTVACGDLKLSKKMVRKIPDSVRDWSASLCREKRLKPVQALGFWKSWWVCSIGLDLFGEFIIFSAFNQDVIPCTSFPGPGALAGGCHIPCVPRLVSPQTHRFRTAAAGEGLRAGIWSYSVFSGTTYLMHMDLIHFWLIP